MSIELELDKLRSLIDTELNKTLTIEDNHQKRIFEAINYSIYTGGKRLRPIMNLKSCEMFSGDFTDSIPYALSIEMIHTYSLIHDDLPSMDNDDFRRGKPTSHRVFGEAMAILSGDGLLNLAFESVLDMIYNRADFQKNGRKHVRALSEISKYSGIYGMIGGQVVDLLANHHTMTREKLIFMYKTKTAALIQAALVTGAIIGGAKDEEIEIIREFGYRLGMAYQIRDDILDFEEDSSIKKLTFLTFYDLDTAKKKVDEFSETAIDTLKKLKNKDISFFKSLTESLILRTK